MIIRAAVPEDISQIQSVRHSITENRLSNPDLVTDEDCKEFLTVRGRGWVCAIDHVIVGFSIADLKGHNIWALFIRPDFEKKGIGRRLHHIMLGWYFKQTPITVWLRTSTGTRAEQFYRKVGWTKTGAHGNGEIRFQMTYADWKQRKDL